MKVRAAAGRSGGNGAAGTRGAAAGGSNERSYSTMDEVVKMVAEAQVKTVMLTHFEQRPVDEEVIRKIFAPNTPSKVVFAVDMLELVP